MNSGTTFTNKQDSTPLYLAARNGKAAVVNFLAKEGADLDAVCSSSAESKVDSETDVAPTAIHVFRLVQNTLPHSLERVLEISRFLFD